MKRTEPAAVSLGELVASLSLAVDLGLGLPMEHVLRQTVIATRLSEVAGFDDSCREAVYYASLLAWVGCTADSSELARLFGDDLRIRAASYESDLAGLPLLTFMVRNAGAGSSPMRRLALVAEILTTKVVEQSFASHCDSAAVMASRLGVGDDVVVALGQIFERWDGKGTPGRVGGAELTQAVRVLQLADVVEVYDRLGGVPAAVAVARERRGEMFDPALVDAFCAHAPDMLSGLDESSWETVIGSDPQIGRPLTEEQLNDALASLGDFADLKSPWWAGHSRGVADLAGDAASQLGLGAATVVEVRRAGWIHDIGVIGVSNAVWDRPGPLSATDRERARTHPYLTERTFARSTGLAAIGQLAGLHHERVDGSGYPAGLAGDAVPRAARVLGAADVYHALREPRPHRDALDATAAAVVLREEARDGRLDGEVVNAVLSAAGHRVRRRPDRPGGLTPREVEVLVLLARGRRNREIAETLGISTKTVSTHLERVYAKAGVTTRSAATLFAMRHGLLGLEDVEDLG